MKPRGDFFYSLFLVPPARAFVLFRGHSQTRILQARCNLFLPCFHWGGVTLEHRRHQHFFLQLYNVTYVHTAHTKANIAFIRSTIKLLWLTRTKWPWSGDTKNSSSFKMSWEIIDKRFLTIGQLFFLFTIRRVFCPKPWECERRVARRRMRIVFGRVCSDHPQSNPWSISSDRFGCLLDGTSGSSGHFLKAAPELLEEVPHGLPKIVPLNFNLGINVCLSQVEAGALFGSIKQKGVK